MGLGLDTSFCYQAKVWGFLGGWGGEGYNENYGPGPGN